jgi:DNA-3-methyladenine glycosylase II
VRRYPGAAKTRREIMDFHFRIRPIPPFRLDLTVWALRRRPNNQMDLWDGRQYRRVLVEDKPVLISAVQSGSVANPIIRVAATGSEISSSGRRELKRTVIRMLGARVDLGGFYAMARKDRRLKGLADRLKGFKPPQFPTLFETLVNGISCQQLSLIVGLTLMNRLAAACGMAVGNGERRFGFPRPREVARLRPEALRAMGYNRNKSLAILRIARGISEGGLDLSGLDGMADEPAVRFLRNIPGVGPWTAEYTLLRGLGRINIFPGGDVGAKNGLQRWLNLKELDFDGAKALLEQWDPFGGLIYFHLLLQGLAPETKS